jgi:hypothetical protein
MPHQPPSTYRVVLVPAEQTTQDGCRPGHVKLTGTPGQGAWEEWGPYPVVGELTMGPYRVTGEVSAELAALGFGVPCPPPGTADVPSGA